MLYGDFNDPEFILLFSYQALYGLVGIFLFHITSSLRLNRFFTQEKYKNYGAYMTDVLNSQSDAIIAFECVQENGIKMPNFLFNNIKSMELFNFDFVK